MKTEDMKVDGNAIGGLLMEIFASDLTASIGVCASCSSQGNLAMLDVYMHAPGVVGRCRSCGAVMIRIVRSETRTWLDLSGTRSIEITSQST